MPADYQLFVNGQSTEASSGETFETLDPSTGQAHATVARAGPADVDKAVAAARTAFEDGRWSGLKPERRAAVLQAVVAKLKDQAGRLIELEVRDAGGTVRKTRSADVAGAMFTFRTYAEFATRLPVELPLPFTVAPGPSHNYLRREPVGVCAGIIPWNFPIQNAAWKLAPALAAGNTVVLKPAEQTPCTAVELAKLCAEAGVPDGVVNVLPGYGPEAGEPLVTSPEVDKVAFTGSTEVGKLIVQAAAGNLKKVTLELGGKSPQVLYKDADMDVAIPGAANGIFFNQGQCCNAGSRLYIERDVYDEVVQGVSDEAKKIKVGPGLDPDSQMGPLTSAEQRDKVLGYMSSGLDAGARAPTGGGRVGDRGYFVEPTVLTDTTPDMKVVREEIFGPVVCAIPFGSEDDDVIRSGNDTSFGLASGIWTRDINKAHRTAHRLRAGTVWINCYSVFDAAMPFGGYKESGWGREMGHNALENYLETKSVVIQLA
jgi:phenylacetaldehyde dehydrogenase